MDNLIGFYALIGEALVWAAFLAAIVICGRIAIDIYMAPDYEKQSHEAKKEVDREKKG